MNEEKIKNICFCICNSIGGLLAGGLIYVFTRSDTYINRLIGYAASEKIIRSKIVMLISCYFADWLWAYALFFALKTMWSAKNAAALSISVGMLWEVLQLLSVVSGTGDVIDIVMYFTAIITAVIILKIWRKSYEKNNLCCSDGSVDISVRRICNGKHIK